MIVGQRLLLWPGALALIASPGLAVVAVLALLGAATRNETGPLLDGYSWHVLRFTVYQATLSTVLALLFALPVARALARRSRFPGRTALIRLFGLPLVLPVIVAVFGIVAVWGHNGAVSRTLVAAGLPGFAPLYGLSGILIAHTFFNMPLAVRLLLPVWDSIPGESWRLANQLDMSSWQIFRLIEFPRIAPVIPGIAMLSFLLCFSSFSVVLVLGGGPGATTLEVAIWQALRLEFEIDRAVALAGLQVTACLIAGIAFYRMARSTVSGPTEGRRILRPDISSTASKCGDILWLSVGTFWIGAPLAAAVAAGISGPLPDVLGRQEVWAAAVRSVVIGLSAGFLALAFGSMLAVTARDLAIRAQRTGLADWVEILGSQTLIVSPVVLGAGLFVLLIPHIAVFDWAIPLAIVLNGLIAIPYVIRLVGPVLRRNAEHHDRLCASLGLSGLNRLVLVEWPAVAGTATTAMAISAALATGDLTAIVLFGSGQSDTLAKLLYSALGTYRMGEAAVLAMLLTVTCLAVFVVVEGAGRIGRRA